MGICITITIQNQTYLATESPSKANMVNDVNKFIKKIECQNPAKNKKDDIFRYISHGRKSNLVEFQILPVEVSGDLGIALWSEI